MKKEIEIILDEKLKNNEKYLVKKILSYIDWCDFCTFENDNKPDNILCIFCNNYFNNLIHLSVYTNFQEDEEDEEDLFLV